MPFDESRGAHNDSNKRCCYGAFRSDLKVRHDPFLRYPRRFECLAKRRVIQRKLISEAFFTELAGRDVVHSDCGSGSRVRAYDSEPLCVFDITRRRPPLAKRLGRSSPIAPRRTRARPCARPRLPALANRQRAVHAASAGQSYRPKPCPTIAQRPEHRSARRR